MEWHCILAGGYSYLISHGTMTRIRQKIDCRNMSRIGERERGKDVRETEAVHDFYEERGMFVWIISALQIAVLRLFQWLRA